ncbi:YHS domain-containing protein [Agromyces mediolanus]|uniref:YHS domain-containing protein n=1 Tax=Agromyces mediolanus TaxID=41986 RepID=UPI00203EF403|nr:YHS domain-containing protein [Agromyces mediolanus]MCM3658280.1 YHS domain-containing protein [Agromyces mediolanus]
MTNDTQANSCCSTGVAASDAAHSAAVSGHGKANLLGGGSADDQTTCPVMVGSPVSKAAAEAAGLFRDYEGERYYFCCAGCGPAFDSDPAKYAANMA